jgi:hypothetical protein
MNAGFSPRGNADPFFRTLLKPTSAQIRTSSKRTIRSFRFGFSATNQYTASRSRPAISFCVRLKSLGVPLHYRFRNQANFIGCEITEAFAARLNLPHFLSIPIFPLHF